MTILKASILAGIIGCTFLLGSCSTDYLVTESAPDYITSDSLRNSVATIAAQPIISPARIISAGNYLFVNEPYKGWHVIDNSVTSSPRNIAYITAPGSLDGSATQGYLYLQNSVDLVVLNIANPAQPVVVKRLEKVLNFPAPPHSSTAYGYPDMEIINWHDTTVLKTISPGF